MMPSNVFSTDQVRGRYIGARGLGITATQDYHDGGIALNDASQGLQYQRWRVRLFDAGEANSRAMLSSPNTPEFELYAVPYMTEVSLSFDQNMRPALAYVIPAGSRLWWYDSVVSGMVVTSVDGQTPRIAMDDGRFLATEGYQRNDIILGYKRSGALYYRQQRDRFLIERDPTASIPEPQRTQQRALIAASGGLIKIGLSRQLRLQFMLDIL
ncbi:hypothetical protein [Bowmanella yangjiangensis]|uniref:Uncharacterized protein n=1 Tax=Bowmanella yangjiangensis TaxID=2811230 RepID=A0ABS3CYP6_9ALTE|nr:hypothetical protein [Bowmanella yangjiangensis]MBN7822253.1 hypothetical protein [Bowmanella yangjiangensis]